MSDALQPLSSEAARPGSTTVIDCAAYCGGVRVADVGIDQIRGTLARERSLRVARAVRAGKGHAAGGPAAVRPSRSRDRRRVQRAPAAEARALRELALRRPAHGAPRARRRVTSSSARRTSSSGTNYLVTVRHGSLRSHIGVRQRCESTPQLLVQGPRLRPVRAHGLRRRSVPSHRSADGGGGRGSRGRDLRRDRQRRRHRAHLPAQARPAGAAARRSRRSSRSAIA